MIILLIKIKHGKPIKLVLNLLLILKKKTKKKTIAQKRTRILHCCTIFRVFGFSLPQLLEHAREKTKKGKTLTHKFPRKNNEWHDSGPNLWGRLLGRGGGRWPFLFIHFYHKLIYNLNLALSFHSVCVCVCVRTKDYSCFKVECTLAILEKKEKILYNIVT